MPILLTVLFLIPLWLVVATSLRKVGLPPPVGVEWLPNPVVASNYVDIFNPEKSFANLGRYVVNSVIVVGVAIPVTLITASLAGFAMSQMGQTARKRLLAFTILLILVPGTAFWLARLFIFSRLGLVDTLLVLVIPAFMGSNPFFVLVFYWSARRIPMELFEAARLEGATALRLWWLVMLPLVRPASAVVGVLAFFMYWSDFLSPLIYIKSEANLTLAYGLQLFKELGRDGWPLAMAAAVFATAPVVALFLAVQRNFWPRGSLITRN
jgi:multiple sugar transport system permease protein